jgi:hypothetical protein
VYKIILHTHKYLIFFLELRVYQLRYKPYSLQRHVLQVQESFQVNACIAFFLKIFFLIESELLRKVLSCSEEMPNLYPVSMTQVGALSRIPLTPNNSLHGHTLHNTGQQVAGSTLAPPHPLPNLGETSL